jgi:hypothetical protein
MLWEVINLMNNNFPAFFSKDDIILGLSYKDWITKWCQWFYGKKDDMKELECESVDNVYFLGTKLTLPYNNIVFDVYDKIPIDKAILINTGKWTALGLPYVSSASELLHLAKKRMDSLEEHKVLINSVLVYPERVTSDIFKIKVNRDIQSHEDPILGHMPQIRKGKYNAVIDGYWLFIKPNTLTKKDYQINSFTSCKTGILSLNINHNITIS